MKFEQRILNAIWDMKSNSNLNGVSLKSDDGIFVEVIADRITQDDVDDGAANAGQIGNIVEIRLVCRKGDNDIEATIKPEKISDEKLLDAIQKYILGDEDETF